MSAPRRLRADIGVCSAALHRSSSSSALLRSTAPHTASPPISFSSSRAGRMPFSDAVNGGCLPYSDADVACSPPLSSCFLRPSENLPHRFDNQNKLATKSITVAGKWQQQQLRRLNIHEYQGAELMGKFGINVPKGVAVSSVEEVRKAIQTTFPNEKEVPIDVFKKNYI
ncbi:hypothetical protein LXL04_024493 [Taraxacum kok-saghyz]